MIQKLEPRHFGPDSGFGGATFSDVIDKVNEIIDAMNGEHDPADIYSEDGRLIAKKDESEDERIRKSLYTFFQGMLEGHEDCYKVGGFVKFEDIDVKSILAWLEKQKINTEGDFGRGYDCGYQAGYAVAMNEMKPKVATATLATLDSEKQQEQKPSTGIYWHAIKKGDKIPCRAYLYKVAYETENNFGGRATIDGLLVPNIENVTCGCDTWYLPADDVKNLPREGLDELQKENPKSADSIPADRVSDVKCEDRWHKVTDSLPDNPREVLCKDEAGNYFIGRYYVGEGWEISNYDDEDKPHHLNPPVSKWIDLPSEKQKEQKPNSTEDMPYIADERFYEREPADSFKYKLAEYMTKCCTKKEGPYGYSYSISSESILQMAKEELIKRGVVQKPAEWSEKHIADVFEKVGLAKIVREQGNDALTNAVQSAMLELSKVGNAEWSEEDEDRIRQIERIAQQAGCTQKLQEEIHDWLKDLRPSWKPSDEQMDALAYAIQILDDGLSPKAAKAGEELEHLREQLKKL